MPSRAPSPALAGPAPPPRRPTLAPLLFDPAQPTSPTPFSLGSAFEQPHGASWVRARPHAIRSLSDSVGGGTSAAWARAGGGEVQLRKGRSRQRGEELGRDPLDDEGDSFVALAALHDPDLFASSGPVSAPCSPSAVDLGFVRRARSDVVDLEAGGGRVGSRSREREMGAARSPCGSSWTRRMGAKAGARVGTQTESASSSPVVSPNLAASPSSPPPGHPPGRRRSATISTPSTDRISRSPASDSLARLVSTPPSSSPASSPTSLPSPRRGRIPSKRRYSLLASPTLVGPVPRPVVPRPHPHPQTRSDPSQPRSAFSPSRSYGSLASLSHVLDRDRERQSTSSPSQGSPGDERRSAVSTPSPSSSSTSTSASASPTPRNGSTLDLRALATGSYRALTSALHLSPSSPSAAPAEAPVLAPWTSVQALRVRFRPGAADDEQLNAWVLGLADLERGGARAWDPRALGPVVVEREDSAPRGERRATVTATARGAWPSVSTSVGSPASVEVRFWDGRMREVDPTGMDQDEIMRAVLVDPAAA
ncbi:hypothetical protein JCM8208_006740 [Rhodotorula glutinis]